MGRTLYNILLVFIFAWGVALRSPEILNQNYLFGYDQGHAYFHASQMLNDHKLRLIGSEASSGSGISSVFHGPGYYYFIALLILLGSGDPYASIIATYISGIFTLPLAYVIGKKMFGYAGGFLVLFFTSISPVFVSGSRFLWSPNFTSPLIVLAYYFLFKSITDKPVFIYVSVFFAALIYHFHLAIAIPFILSIVMYDVIFLKRYSLKHMLYIILILAFVFSPALLFEVRHEYPFTRGVMSFLAGLFSPHSSVGSLQMISRHVQDYWFNFSSTFSLEFFLSNLVLQIVLFFIIIICSFLYSKSKDSTNQFIKFLLFQIFLTWIFFLLLNNTIWDYYLIALHLAYIFLSVYVITKFIYRLVTLYKRGLFILVLVFITSMFLNSARRMTRNYSVDYYDFGGTQKIKGKQAVIDYIYNNASNRPFTVLIFDPPVYTYPYDYLFSWYGQRKFGYVPSQKKSALTYLLIEPDPQKPWSYKGWLETVIKDGNIIDTITLPTGHIVQTRKFNSL